MGFYNDFVLPRLLDLAMSNKQLLPFRERVIGAAEGRVLEIGVGSGRNLPFYRSPAKEILALEPSPKLVAMARGTVHAGLPVQFVEASAEAIPLDDGTVDSIVTTWTLCSVPQAALALAEMRRVLRPGGKLLFSEHGLAPSASVRWWQDRLTPPWRRISGGCHLNRPIRSMIEDSGFRIDRIDTGHIAGPKPMTFMYEGSARPG
ncbi:class I SAM-dependent methyltransferase [Bradyrhizobium sp. 153]|uniref:class I SAM-dependent methyltransferase n=1 Tax=Bradyrhizobium sp. 153 TaxID=2782627 RepID=UPI001FFB11B2|nr:class I SAM-dependent methyltransferase [Bradyrhizobium sp. 153]MCK1668967.1 class I SAM-dependent methyltransferase [Bradyrhizobium sp. 153]